MSKPGVQPGTQPGTQRGLTVDADLRIDLSGPGGRTSATVRGHGDRLVVDVADPRVALAALPRPTVGAASRALVTARQVVRSTGITVDLRGPRGTLASVGPAGIRPGPAAGRVLGAIVVTAMAALSAVVALVAVSRRRHRQS